MLSSPPLLQPQQQSEPAHARASVKAAVVAATVTTGSLGAALTTEVMKQAGTATLPPTQPQQKDGEQQQ